MRIVIGSMIGQASMRGSLLRGSRRIAHVTHFGLFTDRCLDSQKAHQSWRHKQVNAKGGREFGNPLVRARITQCPRRARWPASPAASHAHTTLLGASGARRCGSLDCAPWSLRASSTRPRATAAAATRAPRGVWARCMRAATECAPPPPERHSGAARRPPECAGVRAGEGL